MRVPQEGLAIQSSAIGRIQNIIAYDGWSGSRGKKTVSYSGVTAGKAYLINLGFKEQDHQSYEKQPLQSASADGDLSRFILENAVLDCVLRRVCESDWRARKKSRCRRVKAKRSAERLRTRADAKAQSATQRRKGATGRTG